MQFPLTACVQNLPGRALNPKDFAPRTHTDRRRNLCFVMFAPKKRHSPESQSRRDCRETVHGFAHEGWTPTNGAGLHKPGIHGQSAHPLWRYAPPKAPMVEGWDRCVATLTEERNDWSVLGDEGFGGAQAVGGGTHDAAGIASPLSAGPQAGGADGLSVLAARHAHG